MSIKGSTSADQISSTFTFEAKHEIPNLEIAFEPKENGKLAIDAFL